MKKLYFMYDAIRSHPEVNWRYIVSPTKDFPGTFVTDIVPLVNRSDFTESYK
jgi:hypothetical protein